MEFALGDLIWIYPHDEYSWCPGEIVKIEEEAYIVTPTNAADEYFRVEKSNALPVHPSCLQKVPDLLSLGEFNEGALLNNIRDRFFSDSIYTSVGSPIIISVNPYKRLPIYTAKISESYRGKFGENLNPHLYLMAEKAYSALKEGNQSIIISGESGSGKTEAAKIILSYLASGQSNLSKQVLDTNPILEAFGNAKTLRNDNSSRFGKFIEIHFDSVSFKLLSARILNYLLEKSRIVNQQIGERNYHFFYQICAGASEEERQKYHILAADEFAFLNKGQCLEIEGVDDAANYIETRECMRVLGFDNEEQESILRVVMGILHLGNVEFEGDDKATIQNPDTFAVSCGLLGLDYDKMQSVLTTRVIKDASNNKEIVMHQSPTQALYTRDATAKAIYSKLFTWLVERINKSIYVQQKKPSRIIGLLDIYGFEVFDTNSFEQFCINYANEKLQQHFNHHMFKLEQQEYSKEKIQWSHIKYEDNQECIDLIEKSPLGIITLLDEQCKLPKGSDKQFLSNTYTKLSSNSKLCSSGRYSNDFFGVGHYAGDVFYDVSGFIEKNKDTLNPQLAVTLEKSDIKLLVSVFSQSSAEKKNAQGSLSALTLASQFKNQLHDLIKALAGSNPSYIRCIKPNSQKAAKEFDSHDVQRQLRCAGMLECIRIRKAGYSVRRSLKEFFEKYWIICPSCKRVEGTLATQCKNLISELMKKQQLKELMKPEKKILQVGISMIFMKDELRQALDIEYSTAASFHAIIIQKQFRRFVQEKQYKNILRAAYLVKRKLKEWVHKKKQAAKNMKVKNFLRTMIARRSLIRQKASVKKIKKFLSKAANLVYISYFKPEKPGSQSFVKSEKLNALSIDDSLESSLKVDHKRINTPKELTSGQSPVIDTLQKEVKTLSYLLSREKEKTKSIQEESLYYKNMYQTTLQQLQSTKTNSEMPESESSENKFKAEVQNLNRELKSKDSEIELLKLKMQSFTQTLEELEDSNQSLRKKETMLRSKIEEDTKKYTATISVLKTQAQKDAMERSKSETNSLEKELRSTKIKLREAEKQVNALTNINDEQNLKIQDLEEIETSLKSQIKLFQEESKQMAENYSKIEDGQVKMLTSKIIDLQNSLENLRIENEKLSYENQDLNNELKKNLYYKEEYGKYLRLCNEKKNEIKALENEIDHLHRENLELSNLKSQINKMKNESDDNEDIVNLKMQIDALNQEIDDLEGELNCSKNLYVTLLELLKIKNMEIQAFKENFQDNGEIINQYKEEEDLLLAE